MEKYPIRIYMVDDEIRSIRYMQRLLAAYPEECEMAGSATSALTALEEIPQLQPDVILADINMPGMNGLDMVAELKKRGGQYSIYLLTAYKEFEFAKRGLHLGVAGYLLKHEVTAEQLLAEFRRHRELMRIDREKAHVFAERNLRRFLLQGEHDVDGFPPPYPKSRGYFLALLAEVPLLVIPPRRRQEAVLDLRRLEALECPPPLERRNVISLIPGVFCAFFTTRLTGDIREAQLAAAEALRSECARQGCPVAVLLSDMVDQFFSLPGQYSRMSHLPERAFSLGSRVGFAVDIPACPDAGFQTGNIDPFEELMAQQKWRDAADCVVGILRRAAPTGDRAYAATAEAGLRILWGWAQRFAPEPVDRAEWIFSTPRQVEALFVETLERFPEWVAQGEGNGLSPKTAKAVGYIREHYTENISVWDIACAVQLSEGHLRKLFRGEVGATIVDYLSDYRIEQAKKLLETGEYRVVDVYRMVGFTSSQYFSNVFKKRVGVSPNVYIGRRGGV